jgi:hypothetical protein
MSADRMSVLRVPVGPAATVAYTGTAGDITQTVFWHDGYCHKWHACPGEYADLAAAPFGMERRRQRQDRCIGDSDRKRRESLRAAV